MPEHEDHDGHTISLGAPSKVGPPLPKRPPSPEGLTPEQETRLRELAEKGPPSPRDVLLAAEARRGLPFLLAELDRLRVKRQSLAAQLAEAADTVEALRAERDAARPDLDEAERDIERLTRRLAEAEAQIPHPDHLTIDISDIGRGLDPGDLIRLDNRRDGTQTTLHVIAVTQPEGVRRPDGVSQEDDRG